MCLCFYADFTQNFSDYKFIVVQMEFPTNINKYLKVDEHGFLCCNGKTINKLIQQNFFNDGTKMISSIINQLGANSAKAQALKQIITSFTKFSGTDHRIYIKVQDNKALGFIRVGQKKLFYHDNIGSIKQLTPTCVLDIYVHQTYQRAGIGKEIFQKFIETEGKVPQKLAYDRPSQKLICFLKKHYGLSKYISQNNNYVIFDRYFNKNQPLTKVESNLPASDINRFYKYQKKEKPLLQNKNKTFNVIEAKHSQIKTQKLIKKQQKIQDSLTKLQKQMNRMTLKNFKQKGVKDQSISSFGCPFATEQNLGFRTTSNTYGNYYKYK